jgi:hypothetical protein
VQATNAAAPAKRDREPEVRPSGYRAHPREVLTGVPSPQCYDKPSRGRVMTPKDNLAQLQGSIVELFWPDDGLWYRAEILALNPRARSAKVLYSTGDVEQLALDEVIQDGHLNIVA